MGVNEVVIIFLFAMGIISAGVVLVLLPLGYYKGHKNK